MKIFLFRILCGFCLGISVFAPGISGSVMAIILGIYESLLEIASNPFRDFKKNVKTLLPMGIGAGISFILFIALFSITISIFMTHQFIILLTSNLHGIVIEPCVICSGFLITPEPIMIYFV